MVKEHVMSLSQEIFRACDVRGIVDETLTTDVAYLLGRSFGTHAQRQQQTRVIVGRDGRHSGARLGAALCRGLQESGCEVIDVGQVPTPVLYYATHALHCGTGIMITGSHNPPNYNGFKMMLAGDTLAQGAIQALYTTIVEEDFVEGAGSLSTLALVDSYIARVAEDCQLSRPMKVVVDCGNGVVGVLAEKLFRALGCDFIPLYCDVDGDFPNHHPDPGQPENLRCLIEKVKAEKADLGFAFDGDGDRLGVVTNTGEIIWPDRVMMLFADDLLSRQPGSKIIYDVKCSQHLEARIAKAGGIPIMYKTGHALIKRKMRQEGALLAGEMSGHFFFQERWYGFDDASYAAVRLLEILSRQPCEGSAVFQNYPDSVNTPEINIAISEEKKFAFIERLKTEHTFSDANIITVDGVRAEFVDGWGLVRASNTTPCLVLRFEASSSDALVRIQSLFKSVLFALAPELAIPF